MPYTGTPAERKAKAHAAYMRRRDHALRRQKIRHTERLAVMAPEDLAAFKAQQLEARRRYEARHHARRKARHTTPQARVERATRKRKNRAKDPEKAKARDRALYWKDPARAIAAVLRWAKRHPSHTQALNQQRRARLKNAAINDVTAEQRETVLATAKGRCPYCAHFRPGCTQCVNGTHRDLTVDHITAVVNRGNNTLHNLVACCGSCNSRKSRNPPPIPVQPLLL